MVIKKRLKSIAEDGKTNKELVSFLAKEWHIAKSDIEIASGHSNRIKTLLINKDITEEMSNFIIELKKLEA